MYLRYFHCIYIFLCKYNRLSSTLWELCAGNSVAYEMVYIFLYQIEQYTDASHAINNLSTKLWEIFVIVLCLA